MMPLILIATRRCNLRCDYCDVEKQNISMTEKVARKAIFLYVEWAKQNKQKKLLIRFFGGEPLMHFGLIQDAVVYAKELARKEGLSVLFDLTTNGVLINDDVIDFFKKHSEIDLIISIDGDAETQKVNRVMRGAKTDSYKNIYAHKEQLTTLPNITANMVIAPNQVRFFYKNFLHNYRSGFVRFNFLPAYLVFWGKKELGFLMEEFNKIIQFVRTHDGVSIKNTEIMSTIPFFNSGFIIDCNGDLFDTNMVLSAHFAHLRNNFKKGNVLRFKKNDSLSYIKNGDMVSCMRDTLEPGIFYSMLKVDAILTNFVKKSIAR